MSQTSLTCPECGASLRLAATVAPGKKVRCPKCQGIAVVPAVKPRSAARAASRRAPEIEDEPEPRRRKGKKTRQRSPLPLYLAGAGVLLAAAVVVGIILLNRSDDPKPPADHYADRTKHREPAEDRLPPEDR